MYRLLHLFISISARKKPQTPVKKYVESFDGVSEKVQNGRRRLGMYDCSRALKALERIPRRQ